MTQLLDGLADLSRLDAREVSLDRRPEPIAALLSSAADALGAAIADRHQRLELSLSPGLPEVLDCDAERLVQALTHLVAHAVRVSPQGATLRLGAASEGAELVLTVSDQAPPLPPDALAQLLAPAPRPCGPTRLNQHLGLLIARCLAEAHGGRLEIDCAADRGSTFRVRLPASPA
jgi:signal transduction histidine kinase